MEALSRPAEQIAEDPVSGDRIRLLDGGAQAFPRMLEAIAGAKRSVHLEVYAFALDSTGHKFISALSNASAAGVRVSVVVDGWGSLRTGRSIAAQLRAAGCRVTIYNRFLTLLLGRWHRNHRKLLLVDDQLGYFGGINIGDPYADPAIGWADVALEVHGPAVAWVAAKLRGEKPPIRQLSSLRIFLSGPGGGKGLSKRYLKAIGRARDRVLLAHAYFLPTRRLVRSLTAAARRGVHVTLLLAGRSDVPFARAATMRLYRHFLLAGVEIFEWTQSVLHAKAAAVDGKTFLVGSFNLDPFSLANLEELVEVYEPSTVAQGELWIQSKLTASTRVTLHHLPGSIWRRWLAELVGLWAARGADWLARAISARHPNEARAALPRRRS
jgi:cardiolipin synthase